MKKLYFVLLLVNTMSIFSCKKNHANPPFNLSLIQHKWSLVSHNGEALRYVGVPGDYYNFALDNFLYRYINKVYDTMYYSLLSDNKTLSLYPAKNGVRTNVAMNYDIKILDSSHFVIESNIGRISSILDSLGR